MYFEICCIYFYIDCSEQSRTKFETKRGDEGVEKLIKFVPSMGGKKLSSVRSADQRQSSVEKHAGEWRRTMGRRGRIKSASCAEMKSVEFVADGFIGNYFSPTCPPLSRQAEVVEKGRGACRGRVSSSEYLSGEREPPLGVETKA